MDPTPAVQREQDEDDEEEEVDLEASSVGSSAGGRSKRSELEREAVLKRKEQQVEMDLQWAELKTKQAEMDRREMELDRRQSRGAQNQHEQEWQQQQMQQGGRVSGLHGVEGSPPVQTPAQQQPQVGFAQSPRIRPLEETPFQTPFRPSMAAQDGRRDTLNPTGVARRSHPCYCASCCW